MIICGRELYSRRKRWKYDLEEGVVAKGLLPKGRPPHSLWMAKFKTAARIEKLKTEASKNPDKFKIFCKIIKMNKIYLDNQPYLW